MSSLTRSLKNTRNLFEAINVSSSFDQLLKGTSVYSREAAERRYFERTACDYSAILYASDVNHNCRVVDISAGGAKLDRILEVDKDTNISINIEGAGKFAGRIISHDTEATRLQLLNSSVHAKKEHEDGEDKK